MFDNVKSVVFHEKDYDRILAISSREGEIVQLENAVMAQGNVEVWLGQLLNEAMSSLHGVIRDASRAIGSSSFELLGNIYCTIQAVMILSLIIEFINNFPAQVGLLGIQMMWTRDSEVALKGARSDKKIMSATNAFFLEMLNKLIEVTTRDLTKFDRIKFETLITIHVHQRDIFNDLVRASSLPLSPSSCCTVLYYRLGCLLNQ